MQSNIEEILKINKVIPVIVIDKLEDTLPLADALLAGGNRIMEVTLRTEAGLAAIELLRKERPEVTVGAGTVMNAQQYQQAVEAGAQFMVSPGHTTELLAAAKLYDVPYLPGVMTLSEAMRLQSEGYRYLKLFPATIAGGTSLLKAMNSVLPELVFCPTGGIKPDTAADFYGLNNVHCVGGSWLATAADVKAGNWQRITELAKAAG